jgi:Holliday junction resolvasome RuvABC ATP-dependent DNA helicase subunit
MTRDYYLILELTFSATDDDIKSNYRRLAKKFHPDLNNGSKAAEEKFKELQEAYYHLSEPDKRKAYDDRMGYSFTFREQDQSRRQTETGISYQSVPVFFLTNYVGQERTISNLQVFIAAAKKRDESLEHVLIMGEPGTGKSTLAYGIATELQRPSFLVYGQDFVSPGDLAGILTNLSDTDVLVMEGFERLRPSILDYFVPALSSFKIQFKVDSGRNARSIELSLPRFTFIAVVDDKSRFKPKFRTLFGITCNIEIQNQHDFEQLILRFAKSNNIHLDLESAQVVATYCNMVPKEAFHLLRRIKDFADIYSSGRITKDITYYALQAMGFAQA